MRTQEEIEKDLASARAAYNSMANQGARSKGASMDKCSRRIQDLLKELRALETPS